MGGWHALAVDYDARMFAWGGNDYGQARTYTRPLVCST